MVKIKRKLPKNIHTLWSTQNTQIRYSSLTHYIWNLFYSGCHVLKFTCSAPYRLAKEIAKYATPIHVTISHSHIKNSMVEILRRIKYDI